MCTKIKLTWNEIQGWHLVTNVNISTEHEFSYSDHSVWSPWEEWLSPPDPCDFLSPPYNKSLLRAGTGSILFTVVCPVPEAMPDTECTECVKKVWRSHPTAPWLHCAFLPHSFVFYFNRNAPKRGNAGVLPVIYRALRLFPESRSWWDWIEGEYNTGMMRALKWTEDRNAEAKGKLHLAHNFTYWSSVRLSFCLMESITWELSFQAAWATVSFLFLFFKKGHLFLELKALIQCCDVKTIFLNNYENHLPV